ncbi:MAG: galactose mutarotase [Ruminococcus sp.]|nr:galactose mutarotase [Ruminococcus sp.]
MAIITTHPFGTDKNGNMVNCYSIINKNGASVTLSSLGASVVSIKVPDKNGVMTDVVLGYDTLEGYEKGTEYFGATVGRCSGRIKKGSFSLNRKKYSLPINNGNNHLHGGFDSFSRKMWDIKMDRGDVVFTLLSPDGDEGYPGEMKVTVRYTFDDNNVLTIKYSAISDQDTICNLTNHSYFNLNGHNTASIDDTLLSINASKFIELNNELIPTGKILDTENTPFDFANKKSLSEALKEDHPQLTTAKGFDHSFISPKGKNILSFMASATGLKSGITLDCYSTQPILHLYTANYVDTDNGKNRACYKNYSGFCMEAQGYPDAVNQKAFPSTILKANTEYKQTTKFAFSVFDKED